MADRAAEGGATYRYFDYAATAPLCAEAAEAMAAYMVPGPENLRANGNANSLYSLGRDAFAAMEDARRSLARSLGARRPDEVIFTSGATEADDAALLGLAQAAVARARRAGKPYATPTVITSAVEHEAVLQPCKRLEAQGFSVVHSPVDKQGFVRADSLRAALSDQVVLVSVQMANSEVGSIQPIKELAALTHDAGALFHTDAVQALGKTKVDLQDLGVDAASFSAHKVGGPKGIGALYLKARTPFEPLLLGGGQEAGKRSGTQNVCGMAGFAAACKASVDSQEQEQARLGSLRDCLYEQLSGIKGVVPTVSVAPGCRKFLPNIVHVTVRDMESETLILRMDKLGFGVSGGSACASHSLDPSHVLTAMGVPSDRARGALRLSMGRYTTEEDVSALTDALRQALSW